MSSPVPIAFRIGLILVLAYLGLVVVVALLQRHLIYQPDVSTTEALQVLASGQQLQPWTNAAGTRIGWFRPSPHGGTAGSVLILHGNAGSAVDRDYLADPLQQALPLDVYILEYPGYGDRTGSPSQASLLAAADEAGDLLIRRGPLYLVGESLGTGPTAHLAGRLGQRGLSLRTDADPVNARRRGQGAIGLHGDAETPVLQGCDQGRIQLEQGLAAGADHQPVCSATGPCRRDRVGQRLRIRKAAAPWTVHANKVGVAEGADRLGPVGLAPGPEVAARKSAEHGRPAGLPPLPLQGQEDFLDRVAHGASSGRPCATHSDQPLDLSSHAGQMPQP